MGGPIVRTGTTPAFWANWEKAFGKAGAAAKKSSPVKKGSVAKKAVKSAKAKPAGKAKKKKK